MQTLNFDLLSICKALSQFSLEKVQLHEGDNIINLRPKYNKIFGLTLCIKGFLHLCTSLTPQSQNWAGVFLVLKHSRICWQVVVPSLSYWFIVCSGGVAPVKTTSSLWLVSPDPACNGNSRHLSCCVRLCWHLIMPWWQNKLKAAETVLILICWK